MDVAEQLQLIARALRARGAPGAGLSAQAWERVLHRVEEELTTDRPAAGAERDR
ncbi:hypothetical protein [Streptomyces sp. NPDC048191]|uniref:hypothetical protein n=1 Tax=Streptomyces sp. NPDC048191 TaxID=3155484 RepID=UPI0033C9326B